MRLEKKNHLNNFNNLTPVLRGGFATSKLPFCRGSKLVPDSSDGDSARLRFINLSSWLGLKLRFSSTKCGKTLFVVCLVAYILEHVTSSELTLRTSSNIGRSFPPDSTVSTAAWHTCQFPAPNNPTAPCTGFTVLPHASNNSDWNSPGISNLLVYTSTYLSNT